MTATVGAILTLGYGTFSDVNHVVTLGYNTSGVAPPVPLTPPATGGHGIPGEHKEYQTVTIYGRQYKVKSWQAYYSLLHHLTEVKERREADAISGVQGVQQPPLVDFPSQYADTTFRDWTDLAQREVKRKEDAKFLMALLRDLKESEGDFPIEVLLMMADL